MQSDIKIIDIRTDFVTLERRSTFHYAKGAMTHNLVANVAATVVTRAGAQATGRGSIHLAAPWAFPSAAVDRDQKLSAMRETTEVLATAVATPADYAHPIDFYWSHRDGIHTTAKRISQCMQLAEPLPGLAAYVCYAAIDMALLDAFGLANGASTYACLGPAHCAHDLSHYLGDAFEGKYAADFIAPAPRPATAFAHTVGESDSLTEADLTGDEPDDGLPNTLEQWIASDGVKHFKLKLSAGDMDAAIDRTAQVFALAQPTDGKLTADFNEACADAAWLVEYLRKLRERSPGAFDALLYVEQPFDRDAHVSADEVAMVQALKPLVADEAMTSVESVRAILDRGWAGIALKVGKVMSSSFLHVAAARQAGRFITAQDLCNSGLAHVASVGLASRIPLTGGAECNGRQFVPYAFPAVRQAHPEPFTFHDGMCDTASLDGPGLSFARKGFDRS